MTITDYPTVEAAAASTPRARRRSLAPTPTWSRVAVVNWGKLAPLLLVAIAVGFNLFVLRTELRHVVQVNDTTVHISMVRWAEQHISAGKLVFDGWFPRLQMGLPQFHHYQSLPHIVAGAFATVFGAERTVAWTYYLGLSLWPICIFWTMRLWGFGRWTAGITALIAPLITSVTGYGYEHASYVWQGNGVWSQLWGMWLFPLALVFSWRAVSRGKGYAVAALFLGLTIACHLLTGYLTLLCFGIWILLKPRQLLKRVGRSAVAGIGGALVASWVIVPLLLDSKYSLRSQYNVGTFWFDSYGGGKVVRWLFTGELFDHTHWPVFTVLIGVGFAVCGWRFVRDERMRAILAFFVVSLLLLCGRDTIGFFINFLPGNGDLLIHRFVIAVHLGGIFLAGIGASWLAHGIYARLHRWRPRVPVMAIVGALIVAGVIVLAPAWTSLADYDATGARWINQQRALDATSGRDFTALAQEATAAGGGRVFAGSASGGGKSVGVLFVPGFSYLLDADADQLGFTLRTLSLTGDAETVFDETNPAHYDLFDVRYVILPSDHTPKVPAERIDTRGPWSLWQVKTSGYLEVVDTTPAITADRTNLLAQTRDFLHSATVGNHLVPSIAFGGASPAAATAPKGDTGRDSPGDVLVQYSQPDEGIFGGQVEAKRPAVVMLKTTYDPRLHATVDGRPAKTQMLAPSFVGVAVPAGRHTVAFQYEPFGYYWLLFTLGVLTLLALAVLPRYGPRALAAVRGRNETGADPNRGSATSDASDGTQ